MTARKAAAALALLALIACAKMGAPPGGPPDKVAPKLLATVPESVGVYPGWKRDVEFRFDEIVSEGSSPNQGLGTGDLEKLILLSPSSKVPVIHWHRDRITVRPKEGWKPNRVYRIELLPGIADLRRNRLDTTTVLTFSTGGAVPTDTLRGLAIDWVQGRVAVGALVELILRPDSLVYRAITDSAGRFDVGPLPNGEYLVYGVIDQNHDQRRGRRESYDSAVVAAGKSVPALWLIPRDTVGPRISQVSQNDSLSATVSFNSPLAPGQRFDSTNVVLRLQRDSSIIPIRSVLPRELDDSLQKIARATADSLRVERDTTIPDSVKRARLRPPPVSKAPALGQRQGRPGRVDSEADSIIKSRPRLIPSLVIRVDSAWVPETKYLIEVTGVKSAAGVPGTSKSVLAIPKRVVPPARDSLKVTRDSLKTERDSLKVPRDTLKADTAGARPIIKKPFKKPATP